MLRQVDIQLLGALHTLRFLNLQVPTGGTTEERLAIGSDKHFSTCLLVFGQGVMSRLQRLKLYFEARMRVGGGFDVGMENLTSLEPCHCRSCVLWCQDYGGRGSAMDSPDPASARVAAGLLGCAARCRGGRVER